MREILFRVKDDLSHEWLFGCPVIAEDKESCYFFTDEKDNTFHQHIVTRKTLGQYTGLTDKNGTKIFEGDILCAHFDSLFPEDATILSVEWVTNGWYIKDDTLFDIMEEDISNDVEIIGNIYDNPELLEGEKNNG